MTDTPVLTYVKSRGIAQTARILFFAAGVKYKDVYLTEPEQFIKLRNDGSLLFMQLPLLEIDGLKITQSRAIARYLANKYGFYTSDPKKNAIIDMVYEGAKDFYQNFARPGFYPENKDSIRLEFKDHLIPRYLPGFLKVLEQNGCKYLVDNKLTLADIAVLECLIWNEEDFPGTLNHYPKLKIYFEKLKEEPGIAKYLASDRFEPVLTPEFAIEAKRILLLTKNPF